MKENYRKYAELLLKRCLSIKKDQPLLISTPIDAIEFIRILTDVALECGVNDIYFDFTDEEIKHSLLKYFNNDELNNNNFFNKKIFDDYAKKGAAFLTLYADNPDKMIDIDKEKIAYTGEIFRTSRKIYKEKQLAYQIPWCIACVSTPSFAKKVLPNSSDPVNELWNLIFKMCLVDSKDPIKSWNEKLNKNKERIDKLNNLKIKYLKYKNSLGTDFSIGFKDNIWCGGSAVSKDGRNLIVNMPTEEIFTSPNKLTSNGIVYSSKPLVYNGYLINDFWIKFKDGKVIDFDAVEGKEILDSIIKINGGNYLGEVALVDVNSPISKSNTLFYKTLYDENASCHLALGSGFTECSNSKNPDWLNKSDTHVDFMIGTNDLNIEAITDKGKVLIMKDGKFQI